MNSKALPYPRIRSAIMAISAPVRVVLKGVLLALHIVYALALAVVYPLASQQQKLFLLRHWSRALLGILNIRLEIGGCRESRLDQGELVVANHISWLDVFVLNVVYPSSFVAKSEVRGWPVIGLLCKRARTIFISRANRADTARANALIQDRMVSGECVALFAEGTSTDGTDVAPFHSSLFQSAIDASCPVLPLAIRYHDGTGGIKHDAAFVGDMSFLRSLGNVLSSESLYVTLVILPAIVCTGKSRRVIAAEAHASIRHAVLQLDNVSREIAPVQCIDSAVQPVAAEVNNLQSFCN